MTRYTTIPEIDRVYALQQRSKALFKQTTANERIAKLKALSAVIGEHDFAIKEAIYKDFRKSHTETEVTEIMAIQMAIKETITKLPKWMRDKPVKRVWKLFNVKPYLHYEPKGNTLIITPWNYPFNLPMAHLISSVAAGNTAIVKLTEHTPHINQVLRKIIGAVFPETQVFVVEGEVPETSHLLGLRFDHIHFTGSPAVGKIVMKAASEHLADITLELGGKSPAIIDKNVNLQQVVRNLIWGKFVNAGQTCIAPDYALVDVALKDDIERVFQEELKHAFGEDPQQSTDFARIINAAHFERLTDALRQAQVSGARLIAGGRSDAAENYIEPTVLTDIAASDNLMQDEIFGPIFPLVYYHDIGDALQLIEEKEKPLALYIFSKSDGFIDYVLAHTTAGGTCINDTLIHLMHPGLPFGGVNNSGIGQSLGKFGFKAFSHERAVADVTIQPMSKLFWFPYGEKTQKILRFVRKLMG
ncbi:aldehyde dehydrogenase family protein [Sphingobacterium psychroaquaticum]|uniref:aldehyde dehydrogenase family protein n=1 Tax=Sphingobacterium psychroaquaticum TaxID=561061 RepID=UPI00106A6012|nr:aldehyde dehydrogenase family protein [Sphingobacterium psychroaquaticum]QBQ40628.1 aldehyde dehydrogenase family protein [Sphingobacterium psychroaquaticum]